MSSGDTEQKVRFEEDAVCEVCGRYGAYVFDGKTLCAQCYEESGSCCPEFTRDAEQES